MRCTFSPLKPPFWKHKSAPHFETSLYSFKAQPNLFGGIYYPLGTWFGYQGLFHSVAFLAQQSFKFDHFYFEIKRPQCKQGQSQWLGTTFSWHLWLDTSRRMSASIPKCCILLPRSKRSGPPRHNKALAFPLVRRFGMLFKSLGNLWGSVPTFFLNLHGHPKAFQVIK